MRRLKSLVFSSPRGRGRGSRRRRLGLLPSVGKGLSSGMAPFLTEQFYAQYEFTTRYQLSNSDCETVSVGELLGMAEVPMGDLADLSLGYTDSRGSPALREAIAECYESVSPEDVVVLGAPIEGIYLAARCLVGPGDEVIAASPAYDALVSSFEAVTGTEAKRWEHPFGVAALRRMISPRTKLVVANFPHNPTGHLPTADELRELTSLGIRVFCDEMYFGLNHSAPAVPSVADLGGDTQAVVLSGLSKTYGLPGLRTGWLVVKDEATRADILNYKYYTTICPPAPSEFLALAALKVRENLRHRSLTTIKTNLALAADFFNDHPNLFPRYEPPLAGSTALVEINVPSATAFAATLARDADILLHPAATLGVQGDRHVRIGLGRKAFGIALERFDAYLRAHPPSSVN